MVSTIQQQEEITMGFKSKKFLVWLFVVSSTIMFGGWTSYYLVFMASKGKGHGLILPEVFTYSTIVLVASSITLFIAARSLKKGDRRLQQIFLWITLALGIVFGVLQYQGWSSLVQTGANLVNNNAAISMIYIVSGFHLLHILGGLAFIINSLVGSYREVSQEVAEFKQDITSIFWHFIDILWIYLYVFLLLNS
jgi:cytochrome c oxidase subunit 3